jgi:hypothetical protein
MGMFDIFTNNNTNAAQQPAAPAAAQPGQPIQPGNFPPNAGAVDPANPQVPPGTVAAAQPVPTVPDSPLSQYEKLWEPVPVDPNNPIPDAPLPLTAEQVQKAVANANFSQAITPDHMTAISEGGETAQAAMSEVMNAVAQQVMVQATMVGNKLTEKAVAEALEKQKNDLPQMLREQATTAHLTDTNPIFNNPAIAPVVESAKGAFLQKFPNATPAEITTMTQDYILAMGEAFAPNAPDLAPGEQDWTKFA